MVAPHERPTGDGPRSLEEFAEILRLLSDAAYISSVDGTILTWNAGAERLYGYRASEMIGRKFRDVMPDPESEDSTWILGALLRGESIDNLQVQRRRVDGTVLDLSVTMSAIRGADGQVDRLAAVVRDITETKDAQRKLAASLEQLRDAAYRDPLTGLASRLRLLDYLDHLPGRARDVSIVAIDVDNFQFFNNTFGHAFGDDALRLLASILVDSAADTDVVARVGADEFVIVSIEDGVGRGEQLAQRIQARLTGSMMIDDQRLGLTAGIGVASAPNPRGASAQFLLRRADLALYEAKRAGHGLRRSYDAAMEASFVARNQLEYRLRQAESSGELSVAFQPICAAASGRIVEVEALMRWHQSESGPVSPADFIPVAERSGMIVALGAWVLRQACSAVAHVRQRGNDIRLSVNVSPRQLAEPGFAGMVADTLQATSLPADRLIVEITESAIASSAIPIAQELVQLRELGVGLAVDDFGTGQSSLARLHALPFTVVKIDKSLVDEIAENRSSGIIVDAVVGMAHGLGLKVVAEGVEHQTQLDRLRELGCDLIQGFLLHRPMPMSALEAALQGSKQPHLHT